jgi:hypothetical protein
MKLEIYEEVQAEGKPRKWRLYLVDSGRSVPLSGEHTDKRDTIKETQLNLVSLQREASKLWRSLL